MIILLLNCMKKEEIIDDRLKLKNRDIRAKKSFNFVEAGKVVTTSLFNFKLCTVIYLGKYVREADIRKAKEERKIIAGYASGRKAPEVGFLRF